MPAASTGVRPRTLLGTAQNSISQHFHCTRCRACLLLFATRRLLPSGTGIPRNGRRGQCRRSDQVWLALRPWYVPPIVGYVFPNGMKEMAVSSQDSRYTGWDWGAYRLLVACEAAKTVTVHCALLNRRTCCCVFLLGSCSLFGFI